MSNVVCLYMPVHTLSTMYTCIWYNYIYIYIYLDKYNYIHSITFFHSCTVDLHMEWWQPTWFHQGQRDGVWRSTDGKDSRTADGMSVFFVLCFKITGELVDCERLQFPCFNPSWASFWDVLILESDKAEQIFNSRTSWCCSLLKEKPKSRTPALHDGVPFSASNGEPSADNELSRDPEDGRIWPQPWTGTSAPPEGRADPWHTLDMVSVGFWWIFSIFAFHFSRRSLFWSVLILNDPYFLMIMYMLIYWYYYPYLWYPYFLMIFMIYWYDQRDDGKLSETMGMGAPPLPHCTGEASLSVAAGGKWIRAAFDAWGC